MLTEMVEYGGKIEVKAMQSEIKKMHRGPQSFGFLKGNFESQFPSSDGKATGTQINNLEQKEERNIQPEQNEKNKNLKKWGKDEEPPGQL